MAKKNKNLKGIMQERAEGEQIKPKTQEEPAEKPMEEKRQQDGVQYRIEGDFPNARDILGIREDVYPGREGKIGQKEIDDAWGTLLQYKTDREAFTRRIRQNQEYFELCNTSGRLRNPARNGEYQKSQSGFLFNSIANKHADFMDNFPEPAILPREESDQEVAKQLSSIIPCILEQNDFESEYSQNCYDKLIGGTGVYGIFWNGQKQNGMGDIEVKTVDIMNLYWQSGVEDIQKSKNLFYVTLVDTETLEKQYPFLKGKIGSSTDFLSNSYIYESTIDTYKYTAVIEWYYKRTDSSRNGLGQPVPKETLHYCKFVPGQIIFADENLPEEYPNGWYEHGLYPFVFDALFPLKGTPAGFGYVDVVKAPQEYIDRLDTAIEMNAEWKASPRYFNQNGTAINKEQFLNQKERLVTYSGTIDGLKPIETPDLPGVCLDVRTMKVDELKETSGNRDFSQGTTSGGVTAASAIAALQEAGSKLSRDMIKSSYNAYKRVIYQEIELIRQFYSIQRCFRITEPNETYRVIQFDNRLMQPDSQANEFGQVLAGRTPYFDIKISAQKASPYARITQNELAKELYSAGMFNPQLADQALICLGMMDFDGKDEVIQKINTNYTMYMQNMQLQAQVAQLSQVAAAMTGDPNTMAMAQAIAQRNGQGQQIPNSDKQIGGTVETDSLGGSRNSGNPKADRSKAAAQERTEVR